MFRLRFREPVLSLVEGLNTNGFLEGCTNSRKRESEADRIGIELAAKAGYDPHAAPRLWEKMVEATGSKGQQDFLSTHPAGEKRQQALAALSRR